MERLDALVIGGGPAGLMAASELARAGRSVVVTEAKPSLGRKFLMAGRSGLNLTRDEPPAAFRRAYGETGHWLAPMLDVFGPQSAQDWARDLGQDVFTGSSGLVFPAAMKASPLLRAWIRQLALAGVDFRTLWRWQGWDGEALLFVTPQGRVTLSPRVTVLALGGASWSRLGSDAAWVPWLIRQGVEISAFKPANMGFSVEWSAHMAPYFGAPVKGVALTAGHRRVRAEFVVSARGIEGGGVYAVSREMREGASLMLDLAPDLDHDTIAARLTARPAKESVTNRLRKALRLGPVQIALLHEFARPLPRRHRALAGLIKALEVRHAGPRPIDEAISVAGGVRRAALDDGLGLRALPGIFAAGEMLDWEAPTGGYLLTACLATGRWAGRAAARTDLPRG